MSSLINNNYSDFVSTIDAMYETLHKATTVLYKPQDRSDVFDRFTESLLEKFDVGKISTGIREEDVSYRKDIIIAAHHKWHNTYYRYVPAPPLYPQPPYHHDPDFFK